MFPILLLSENPSSINLTPLLIILLTTYSTDVSSACFTRDVERKLCQLRNVTKHTAETIRDNCCVNLLRQLQHEDEDDKFDDVDNIKLKDRERII